MNLELRLSVEDSPNSAGVAIDLIRCARLALDRGIGGPIHAAASAFCSNNRMSPRKKLSCGSFGEIFSRLSITSLAAG